MKILVTAFEPFDKEPINPTMMMLERLSSDFGGHEIIKQVLPTTFGESAEIALARIAEFEPDAVLCLGQAGGRAAMTLERVAINVNDATIPDNAGAQPVDEPVVPDGPVAYFSTFPNKAIVSALREAGIPAAISNSAGTYVCNQILYAVLHFIAENSLPAKAGFMHAPYLPVQVAGKPNMPSMNLDDMVRALEIAIRVISGDRI
jgi:pyroglutamyl-peptidase